MPTAATILEAHTVLHHSALDRLYLNAYIPGLQRPQQVKDFLFRPGTRARFDATLDALVERARLAA